MKYKLSLISGAILLSLSPQAYSETYCGNRENQVWTWTGVYENKTMGAEDCYEVGIYTDQEHNLLGAALANNMIMNSGSKMSVVGNFTNSTVNAGAEVDISTQVKIATGAPNPQAPALGRNINITGGLVRVYEGGTLKDSNVSDGGRVYVSNGGATDAAGKAINIEVNNGGVLYAYMGTNIEDGRTGGISKGTIINNGGIEYVQEKGSANNTTINSGGTQSVRNLGHSIGTIIESGGLQRVQTNSLAENTTIKQGGKQYVTGSAIADGAHVYGTQHIYAIGSNLAGNATNTKVFGTGEQIIQQGGSAIGVELFENATQSIKDGSSATNVTINGNARSWLAHGAKILGTTEVNNQGQLQLTSGASGIGAYAESVNLNSSAAKMLVIANSVKSDFVQVDKLSGKGTVQFVTTTGSIPFSSLNIGQLSGNLHFKFNTSIADGLSDYITIAKASGQHKVSVQDSGVEITQPSQTTLDLINDQSSGAYFGLASLQGHNINAVDGGTYMYFLGMREEAETGNIWYLTTDASTMPAKPIDPKNPSPTQPQLPNFYNSKLTTPGTDAIISLASAPLLMLNNEMGNLRFRRGELKANSGESGFGTWGRLISNKDQINAGHAHYQLEQSGFELGADKMLESERGRVFIGTSANLSRADAKHQRGGTSKLDSYGIALHGTYFDQSGLYIDGLLKYNRFSSKLKARSTNGMGIHGDYNQNAVGATVEAGYFTSLSANTWVEPYGRLSYARIDSKTATLNNGMRADIGNQNSFTSELGSSLGTTFDVGSNHTLSPYVKLAWVHEFSSSNKTTINRFNTFNTNLSGDMAKVGLGINAELYKSGLQLYSELNYGKGNKIDSPIELNLGLRYNF